MASHKHLKNACLPACLLAYRHTHLEGDLGRFSRSCTSTHRPSSASSVLGFVPSKRPSRQFARGAVGQWTGAASRGSSAVLFRARPAALGAMSKQSGLLSFFKPTEKEGPRATMLIVGAAVRHKATARAGKVTRVRSHKEARGGIPPPVRGTQQGPAGGAR